MVGKAPRIWGPPLWPYLHAFARIYDVTKSKTMAKILLLFFDELRFVLPCGMCRKSFKVFWAHLREAMENVLFDESNDCPHSAAFIVYMLHDCVNLKLLPEGHAQSPPFRATLLEPIPNDIDDDRLWHFLITMASNFESNSEDNKQMHYVRFWNLLTLLLKTSGHYYQRHAMILETYQPNVPHLKTQQEWMDMVYSAYARWSKEPLSRHEAHVRFGVCA